MRAPWTSRISAERCAFYAFAIGALLFGASAVEDYVCLARRSSGQPCGVLPASLFYVGIGLALVLLIGSAVQWVRMDRSQRDRTGQTIDD